MHRVTWTDAIGQSNTVMVDASDARPLFMILVRAAIRGEVADVLLLDSAGDTIDSWGT
jgi:hypothetical protein